jgi:translation initiation factor IF-3
MLTRLYTEYSDRFKNKVLLIGSDGKKIGEISFNDALRKAQGEGLDLVLINEDPNGSVLKICDFNKEKFQKERKPVKVKKQEIKELRFSPTIAAHDIETKVKIINKFLSKGDKVKITLTAKKRTPDGAVSFSSRLTNILNSVEVPFSKEHEDNFNGNYIVQIVPTSKKG